MGKISEAHVSIRFFGDDLDPQELTRRLQAQPSMARRKGERRIVPNGETRVARGGLWIIRYSEEGSPVDIDEQLNALLDKMTDDMSVWQDLTSRYDGDVFCGLMLDSWNEGFSLMRTTVKRLSDRNLLIGFDVYAPTDTWDVDPEDMGVVRMQPDITETRRDALSLLDKTRRETRILLSGLDPDRVIHTDERAWRVRDILGHLAVWNAEAARSLEAHAQGSEYHCIACEAKYDEYNGPAAIERMSWTMDEVWAEYEAAHAQLKRLVESMPAEKWGIEMLYPWNERGTPERLVRIMMKHERVDHCALVTEAID